MISESGTPFDRSTALSLLPPPLAEALHDFMASVHGQRLIVLMAFPYQPATQTFGLTAGVLPTGHLHDVVPALKALRTYIDQLDDQDFDSNPDFSLYDMPPSLIRALSRLYDQGWQFGAIVLGVLTPHLIIPVVLPMGRLTDPDVTRLIDQAIEMGSHWAVQDPSATDPAVMADRWGVAVMLHDRLPDAADEDD